MLSSLLYIVLSVDYNFQRAVDIFLISWFLGTILLNMCLATIPKLLPHPKGNPVSITVYDVTFESSVPGGATRQIACELTNLNQVLEKLNFWFFSSSFFTVDFKIC